MRRPFQIFALCCVLFALNGCVAAVVGGAVAGGMVAHDRRSASTVINDRNLQISVENAIEEDEFLASHNRIRVVVYNRVILLVGEVVSEQARTRAEELATGFIGAMRLVNQLEVMPGQGFWDRRGDDALGSRVKAGLVGITSLPGFDPSRVFITVAHGNVYLMGLVSHVEAEAVVLHARNTAGVNKVINLFEFTDDNEEPPTPASEAPMEDSDDGVTTYPVQE